MQVTCNFCKRAMNIPDEKLPNGQAFSITCPHCKNKVKVDQHLKASNLAVLQTVSPQPKDEEALDEVGMAVEDNFDDREALVIYEENDQLALILDEVNKSVWTQALKDRNFKVQYAKSPEHAIYKMKFTHFHFIVLHENFGNINLENNPVYQTMIAMPMVTRRNIIFALVGKIFQTLNNMQAFQKSANVVVNEKDIDKLGDILKKSISENENFYKVFKETLHSMGKA